MRHVWDQEAWGDYVYWQNQDRRGPVPALRVRRVEGVPDRPPFERYEDDSVVHCVTRTQAEHVARAIKDRLAEVGLVLHPTQDEDRAPQGRATHGWARAHGVNVSGVHVPPRGARRKNGTGFTSFMPAVSRDASNRMSATVRSLRLHRRTGHQLADRAAVVNPIIPGWMIYHGTFYRSALYNPLSRINGYLLRWIRRK